MLRRRPDSLRPHGDVVGFHSDLTDVRGRRACRVVLDTVAPRKVKAQIILVTRVGGRLVDECTCLEDTGCSLDYDYGYAA